jgi:hypothetical protein
VEKRLELAEAAHGHEHRGLNSPAELARREDRLKKIAEAKAAIERRARERYERERGEYEEKMVRRAAKEKQTGKKPGGHVPKAPTPNPQDKDQVNFTLAPAFASLRSHSGSPESFREFGTIPPSETVAAPGRGCRPPPRISGLLTARPLRHALGTRVALLNGEEG